MNDYKEQQVDSVRKLYGLMAYWHVKMKAIPTPGFIAWQLEDVPRIVSFKSQDREIIAMDGLDCWDRGELKFANVSKEEALLWIMVADENECAQPSSQ